MNDVMGFAVLNPSYDVPGVSDGPDVGWVEHSETHRSP